MSENKIKSTLSTTKSEKKSTAKYTVSEGSTVIFDLRCVRVPVGAVLFPVA